MYSSIRVIRPPTTVANMQLQARSVGTGALHRASDLEAHHRAAGNRLGQHEVDIQAVDELVDGSGAGEALLGRDLAGAVVVPQHGMGIEHVVGGVGVALGEDVEHRQRHLHVGGHAGADSFSASTVESSVSSTTLRSAIFSTPSSMATEPWTMAVERCEGEPPTIWLTRM